MIIINPDESKILSVLSVNANFDVNKCERLFLLYDNVNLLSNQDINNIIVKSSLHNFRLDFYIQSDNNAWHVQRNVLQDN
jgi:hypothetical protein